MCGRYSQSSPAQLVQEAFAADCVEAEGSALFAPRWNIAPTQEAAVVRVRPEGGRRLALLRWGLLPPASGTAGRPPRPLINARAETVASLPAFRDCFRERRCLVPADGFYEWRREGRARQPFHIRFGDRRLFAFAGLWNPSNASAEGGSFTILTCPPSETVASLHDRMPVILPPETWARWLATDTDTATLAGLLAPWNGPELELVAVDEWVNSAEHEGERCVREVAVAAIPRQLSFL